MVFAVWIFVSMSNVNECTRVLYKSVYRPCAIRTTAMDENNEREEGMERNNASIHPMRQLVHSSLPVINHPSIPANRDKHSKQNVVPVYQNFKMLMLVGSQEKL